MTETVTMQPPAGLSAWGAVAERVAGAPPATVIVPIHNGADALGPCLDALVAHTPGAQIVLVDDRSTDPAIGALCLRVLERRPDARLVRQRQSAGFAGAVNSGIRAAGPGRDVVLLNSDTVVTAGWLRKLRTAAHATAETATACPLSNAAGALSVPDAYADAPLPPGIAADHANRALEDASERLYETAPATSGFCLYLRREALDAAGLIDERLILRGYGDDNDLCERISAAGGRHVIDDATFVGHRREGSFGAAKTALKRTNSRVLRALHPRHHARMRAWEAGSRLGDVRRRYAAAIEGALGDPAARARLEPVRTELLVVGEGAEVARGDWNGTRRRLVVTLGGRRAQIDLFGRCTASIAIDERLRAPLVAWLVNRWCVDRLDVRPGLLPGRELQTIRRAWGLTAEGAR